MEIIKDTYNKPTECFNCGSTFYTMKKISSLCIHQPNIKNIYRYDKK